MIGLVWAQDDRRGIGRNGDIPWDLPEDRVHFAALTWGAAVLMGRGTWQSLPARYRPLPGRLNYVLSNDRGLTVDGAFVFASADDAAADALSRSGDLWIIGGASLYSLFVPVADRVVVTEVCGDFGCDTHAPEVRPDGGFTELPQQPAAVSTSGLRYSFREWVRS